MKKVFALILAGGRVDELSVLTLSRPKSALPFGGMYRVIDFPLSNLMHSNIERVGILSQYRSYALLNHIGVGAWWDFVGRRRGVKMLLPSIGHKLGEWYKGTADAVYQNLEFVAEQKPETVMVLSGDHIYKMDYGPLMQYHRDKDADLTIVLGKIKPEESHRFGVAELQCGPDEPGAELLDYKEKPVTGDFEWASLTIYVFKADVLAEVLTRNAELATSYEFGRDIIPAMLGSYNVHGYKFDGYWGYSRTVDEFWRTNMDLLGPEPKIDLDAWQIRTNLDHDKLRDRPPARIAQTAQIENSYIYNGCEILGKVENSILFPGVKVAAGAHVSDSILFFDCVVEEQAKLDHTIADFDVSVGTGCVVGEGEEAIPNKDYPTLLRSGLNLLGKGVCLPPDTTLERNCIVAPALKKNDFDKKYYESGTTVL